MQSMRLEKFGKNVDMKVSNNSQSLLCALNMQVKVHNKSIIYKLGEGVEIKKLNSC